MSKRQRMTWAADKAAASPPALPGYDVEDQDHPAKNQPDPEAHDYENGDTSAWAEDPTPPPYGDSGRPALPGYGVEDQDHPAHKGQVGRQGSLGELVRRKSAKCLQLARYMLGKEASQEAVEDQALDLMDLPDASIMASLKRAGGFLAADDEKDEKDEKESGKKKAGKKADESEEDDADAEKEGGKKAADKRAFGHMAEFDDDELEMLSALHHGQDEGLDPNDLPLEVEEAVADPMSGDFSSYFATGGIDPMGLSDGSSDLTAEDEAAFEEIFGKKAKKAEDEEGEDEGDDEVEGGKRAAAAGPRPQPRKPNPGPQTLGQMTRTASAGRVNDIDELSKLWTSAPDVRGAFGY